MTVHSHSFHPFVNHARFRAQSFQVVHTSVCDDGSVQPVKFASRFQQSKLTETC